jgi:putative transposase
MGYKLDNNMKTSLFTETLAMTSKNSKYSYKKRIHHLDSGFKFGNPKYTEFAKSSDFTMRMTAQYDPYKNEIAERINSNFKI